MVKQALQTCLCGRAMDFPEGQIRTACKCGTVWHIDICGCWFIQATFVAKRKPNHYERYMAWRNGKAGARC